MCLKVIQNLMNQESWLLLDPLGIIFGIGSALVPASLHFAHNPSIIEKHRVGKISDLPRSDVLFGRCQLIRQPGYTLRKRDYATRELVGDLATVAFVRFHGVLHRASKSIRLVLRVVPQDLKRSG
jgi:hypothetical protein